jgi:hypothetical protein
MKTLKVGGLVLLVVVFLNIVPVQTYNPLAHIYVAGRTSLFTWPKADLYYGAIAPDIAWYADPAVVVPLAGMTHYTLFDLRHYATNPTQRAFARGFLTHNQKWGLDAYAHGPLGTYVTVRIEPLMVWAQSQNPRIPINEAMAEFAIETAIDLRLKQQQPLLPVALLEAVLCRSWDDQELLGKVYPHNYWFALYTTEPAFRNLTMNYALALARPSPRDKEALAALGAELAKQLVPTGSPVPDKSQVASVLTQAVSGCGDFMGPLQTAIPRILGRIGWF